MSTDVIAKQALAAEKLLKKPTWSVPSQIQLNPSQEIIVGRICTKGQGVKGVMLHSKKLPSMLSRKHASLKYDTTNKQWTVEDLKSLNGVYINNIRISAGEPTPLQNGDVVCFGVNIDRNVFKFTYEEGGVLKRRCASEEEESENDSQSEKISNTAKRKSLTSPEATLAKRQKLNESATSASEEENSQPFLNKKKPSSRESTSNVAVLKPSPSVHNTPSSLKPSPALSIKSTQEISMDELFEGAKEDPEEVLDRALFDIPGCSTNKSTLGGRDLDATTIQLQQAKEEMDKEKNKLLSSIEALKSELAAKDQLLADKEEKEKTTELENENVISSMQEEFTCVICQELFINAYTLPCAHSFCEWCIKEWMKTKKQKDCPICRVKITSERVHSLVLDNAISKMVTKLSAEEREERGKVEEQHKVALGELDPPKTRGRATRGRGRMAARRGGRASSGRGAATSSSRSGASSSGGASSASGEHPLTIVIPTTPPVSSRTAPIVIESETGDDGSSSDDDSDDDLDDDSSSLGSDGSDPGMPGA